MNSTIAAQSLSTKTNSSQSGKEFCYLKLEQPELPDARSSTSMVPCRTNVVLEQRRMVDSRKSLSRSSILKSLKSRATFKSISMGSTNRSLFFETESRSLADNSRRRTCQEEPVQKHIASKGDFQEIGSGYAEAISNSATVRQRVCSRVTVRWSARIVDFTITFFYAWKNKIKLKRRIPPHEYCN